MTRHVRITRTISLVRACAALLMVVAGLAIFVVVPAPPADAAIIRPFTTVFSQQTNGSIQVTGNTVLTCGTATGCQQAQSGATASSNNNFTMVPLDTDADASTTRSSSANLTIPAGARVLYAGLFWGGARTAGTGGVAAAGTASNIRFRVPGTATYTTLAAQQIDNQTSTTQDYSAYRNVTDLVRSAGAGTYWGADISAATGTDRYAGWSLVVALEDPTAPLRDLTVFSGYATVTTNETVDTTISGFLAPPSGAVGARFGSVTYEGDAGITGDYFQVGTTRLADTQSPSANFFGSRVTNGGTNLTNRNPASLNNLGIDAKVVDAPGVIPNGATSASLRFASTGDFFYPAALTTQIDLYAPTIQGSKSVTNLSGNEPAKVGDVVEYSMTFSNIGDDAATNAVVTDPLPANLTYVPGSLRITAGANTGAKTDATGDDQGEYVAASRTVRVRAGTGAGATTGGRLAPSATTTVAFQARVTSAAAGTTVTNSASLAYRAETIGRDYSYTTADVSTPVADEADVSITKTASPEPVTAGDQVTYALTVRNNGPTPASGVQVVDTLPAGTTYVSSNPSSGSCAVSGQTLTCGLGTIANGATGTVSVVVRVPPGSEATSVTNVARVSTTTSDPNPANNNASTTSTVVRQADVALTKSAAPASPVPGNDVTYTLVATNNGSSRATDVTVTDTLPSSLAVRSASDACTVTGSQVTCTAGGLDPGQSATFTVVATVPSNATTASLTNSARVTSNTPDPTPANNSATATVTPSAPRADLAVTKVPVTSPIVAGRPVQYLLTVTNNGPSDAAGVTLADAVPAALSAVSATSAAGSCTVTGQDVSCALGSVAAGGSVQVRVDGRLAAGATGTLSNTATVSSPTADPAPGNNSATSDAPVTGSADLAVTKTAAPVVDGNVATYTIAVSNSGPSVARALTVSDTIPAPLTYVAASTPQGTCSYAPGTRTVTCTVDSLAVGATATVTVQAGTPADGSARGVDNTATVSAATPDPVPANNSATYALPTTSQADLALTKTVSPSPVVAGQTATWVLTARNNGPSNATGVTVTDTVPARVTGVSAATSTPGATCAPVSGGTVSCTAPNLASGATLVVTVTGTVLPGAETGALTNAAGVTATTPVDPSTDNNSASATAEVVARADVSVVKDGPATAVAGTQVDWTFTVRNDGPSTASGVRLTDTLPAGVTFLSGGDVPAGVTCTADDGQVTCPVGTLAPGQEVVVTVTGTIGSGVPAGTTLTNTGGVGSTTQDLAPGNNSDSHSLQVTESSDVSLTKAVEPETLVPGAEATYVLTVANAGPSDARDVVVTDTLDADLTVREAAIDGGTCTVSGQDVSCTRALLPVDATATVRIRVLVDADRDAPVPNEASVTSPSDSTPGNNSDDVSSDVSPNADVAVLQSASRDRIVAGEGVTYTLTVVNNGPSQADGVTVADTLPAGIVPATATSSAGSCTVVGQQVSCALGDLLPGTPVTITIVAGTSPGATPGPRENTATVTSTTDDATPGNNTSQSTVTIGAEADVRISKAPNSDTFVPGRAVGWSIVVDNTGPSTARGIVVTDTVPNGVTITSAFHGTTTPCAVAGQQVTCDLGDRAPGQRVITITGTLASGYAAEAVTNTARVATTSTDPAPGNNEATATAGVVRQTDLEIVKTIDDPTPVAGQRITYTLSAYNNGPSDSGFTQFIDQLPSGLTDVVVNRPRLLGEPATTECELRAPTNPGTADNPTAPTVFCTGPQFRANLPARVIGSIEATVAPGFTGSLTNTARISSDTIDRVADNNESTVTTAVAADADVSITKTVSPGAVPGQPVTWTLTARNDGPSVARNVVVRDDVDDAITGLAAGTGSSPNPCSIATGNDVTCTLGDLAPGATVTVTLTGGIPAGFTGALGNTATVSSPTDTTPGNNSSSATTTPTARADVAITMTADPTRPVPGEPVTYTIVVTNNGPSVARAVTVEDPVPGALTNIRATADRTPNPCSVTDGVVDCALGDLAPGATVTITVVGDLPPGFTGDLVNTATVDSPTDTQPGNNTATVSGSTDPQADVTITKSLSPTSPVPGQDVTWTLVVTNNGPSVARGVTVRDDLPDALAGVRVSTGRSPEPCTVAEGNDVSCSLGELSPTGPGSSVVVTITAGLPADYTGELANTAVVDSITDSTPDNNTATVTGTAAPRADVSITNTLSPNPPVPGQPVTYTVVVTNNGPSVAREVVMGDDVDDAVTGLTATGASCTIAAGNDVTCTLGDLPPGASVTITLTGGLPAGFTGPLTNTATVQSPTDTTPANNSADADGLAEARANVSISKVLTPSSPVPGRDLRWTVVVSNSGPSVARDVVVRDDVDDAVTGLTASAGATSCTIAPVNDVTCDLGDLAPGSSTTITLAGGLPAGFTGPLANTATVASPTDTTPGNNTATATGTAAPTANVGITKAVAPSNPVPGEDVTWTVVVGNTGPSVARDVVVRDDVNDAITGLTATGAACTIADGNDVTCDLGSVAPGEQVVITLAGDVPPDFTGELSNTATVSSPTDDSPANSTSTADPTTSPGADLSIVKTASPSVPVPGQDITWTVSVTNAGPSVARDVVVTDDVVDAVTDVAASGPCTVGADNEVTCDLGDVGVGGVDASRTITITGRVPADFTGDLGNTATVASPTDTNTGNNTSSTDGTAEPTADLSITKTAAPADPVPGRDTTWTITVTNAGPSVASDVVLRDDVADDLTGLTADADRTPEPCEVADGNDVTCPIGSMEVGETVTVTIAGRVPAGFTGDLDNTATVSSPVDDTPGNNSDSTSGSAVPQADVSITKTATPEDPVPGQAVTWTLVVGNAGPSVARAVVVTDDVLDAVTGLTATAPCVVADDNVVRCALGDLAPGDTQTLTLTGGLPAGYEGAVDNTATVASPTDSTPGNNSDSTSGAAVPQADVSITKTASSASPVPGEVVTWTIGVTNAGPSVARGVVVTDDVLDAITGLTASAPCTIADDNLVTCPLGDVGPGGSRTITLTGVLPADFEDGGAVDNTATVASPTDTNPDNDAATTDGTADAQADVSITKVADRANPVPGQPVTWTIRVTNAGPSVARDVVMVDDVLDDLTDVTASSADLPGDACVVDTGDVVDCDLGDMPRGTTVTITVAGRLPASYTGTVVNTAVVESTTDSTPDNNEATTEGQARPDADVVVTKTLDRARPVPGEQVTWTVQVTNAGPSTAQDVVLTDDVDDAVTGVTATSGATPDPCAVGAGNAVRCELGDLDAGTTRVVTIRGTLAETFTGTLRNSATATSPTDSTTANNTGTVAGEAAPSADVSITKTMAPTRPVAGKDVTFTMVVANAGPSTARDVAVSDTLIDALGGATASMTGGGTCRVEGRAIACSIATLATGAQATVTVTATVDDAYTGEVTNVGTVSAVTPDPVAGNNTSRVTESGTSTCAPSDVDGKVVVCPDLGIEKVAAPQVAEAGAKVTYTVTVSNDGPSATDDVEVLDELHEDLALVSATVVEGTGEVSTAGRSVTAVFATLRPGAEGVVRIVARLADDASGTVPNVALASTDAPGVGDVEVQDQAAVRVRPASGNDGGDGDGDGGGDDPGVDPSVDPSTDDDGVLPDTGLPAGVVPLAALSVLLLALGLWLVRRSRVSGGRR
ncbi:hypothetical protein GCM10023339_05250 [Alloalcanivorax gelatiniphagus]